MSFEPILDFRGKGGHFFITSKSCSLLSHPLALPQTLSANKDMIDHISAVIIAKNAASTIPKTLTSLSQFKEVIVYDNGSSDDTPAICKSFSNVKHIDGHFEGFGPTKNKAVKEASNNWVFSLDADESLSTELVEALKSWPSNSPTNVVGEVLRENHFMGEAVTRGGWGNDTLVRLFNRESHLFNKNMVHESVELNKQSEKKKLQGVIEHDAVQHIGQFLEKVNRYSEIRRETQTKTYSPSVILLKAFWRFFQSYVLKLGILEGWRGMVIAWSNANGVFFKYMKIYADKQTKD